MHHTFSNFASNSRKLKFKPIMIKRPSKPTFSQEVLQVGSVAFERFFSFSTYTVSNVSGSSCVWPSLRRCSPRGSSHSTIVAALWSPFVPWGWVSGLEPLMLGDAPGRVSLVPGAGGICSSPRLARTASSSPQQWRAGSKGFLAGHKLNVWSQLP